MDEKTQSIVEQVMQSGFCLDGSQNMKKKRKQRLRRSLAVQIRTLKEKYDDEKIIQKLSTQLLEKYGEQQNRICEGLPISRHAEVLAFTKHQANAPDDLQMQPPFNSSMKKIKSLNEKIKKQEVYIKRQNDISSHLIRKNQYLSIRSKELSRIRLKKQLSPRSVAIVDNSLFSNYYGYIDRELLEAEVDICKNLSQQEEGNLTLIKSTNCHDVYKTSLANGEIVALKTSKKSLNKTKLESLEKMTYEAKIMKIIGSHLNVAKGVGIVFIKNITALVMMYESSFTLRDFLKTSGFLLTPQTVKECLLGVMEGVEHIHSKGIIHNNIILENIAIKSVDNPFIPVIYGFSKSCRSCASKKFTLVQQNQNKDSNHLPSAVISGRQPPSERSDIFSVGRIAQILAVCLSSFPEKSDEFSRLASNCFNFTGTTSNFRYSFKIDVEHVSS